MLNKWLIKDKERLDKENKWLANSGLKRYVLLDSYLN